MRNHLQQAHGRFSRDFGEPPLAAAETDFRPVRARGRSLNVEGAA